jgi:hypothetical protein
MGQHCRLNSLQIYKYINTFFQFFVQSNGNNGFKRLFGFFAKNFCEKKENLHSRLKFFSSGENVLD